MQFHNIKDSLKRLNRTISERANHEIEKDDLKLIVEAIQATVEKVEDIERQVAEIKTGIKSNQNSYN